MDKKFAVAIATRNAAGQPVQHLQPQRAATLAQALLYLGIKRGIFHNAAFANVLRLQLKLGLYQHKHMPRRAQIGAQGGQYQCLRDE